MDKFVIITNRGYWGKADSLKQALKNAGGFPAEVIIYRFPNHLVDPDSIVVNGMGGVEYKYTDMGLSFRDNGFESMYTLFKLGNFTCSKQLNLKPIE